MSQPAGDAAIVRAMTTPEEIAATFPVMSQLRPHLAPADYVPTVQRMAAAGFRLAAVTVQGAVAAVAGYRLGESLSWGRYLYVDDLVSDARSRSHGHGRLLLGWLAQQARAAGCAQLHLDSGVQRHGAHRFYLRERMDITAFHFALPLS